MHYQILPMDRSHLPQVATLESLCFSHPWSQAMLEQSLFQDNASYLVAVGEPTLSLGSQGTPAILGYAGLAAVAGEGYINNIAVFPEYRRQGVAQALLQVFCNFGQAHLDFLTLEVRASNTSAQALYQGCGFAVEATRRNYYDGPTEDALIMTRRFPPKP